MAETAAVKKLIESFRQGDYICREGDFGADMYIIKSGKVDVLKQVGEEEMVLTSLGKNDFFGEMALFGMNKRTATVKAVMPTDIVKVTRRMLETQYRKVPYWLVTMIKTIAARITTTSKGVKVKHKISLEYSILKCIELLVGLEGTPTAKGAVIPLQVLRDEIYYTTGISLEEIDVWINRFNLINMVRILGGKAQVEIPDTERLIKFGKFMLSKSPEGGKVQMDIDNDTIKAFDRMYKLLNR